MDANVNRLPITGLELRYALCVCLLDARSPLTVPQLVNRVEALGFAVTGRPSKSVSDALRWEVRRGRIDRLGRGLYVSGSMPRSTEWWIRRRVRSRREAEVVAPTLAET
ncbi:MAG: hypothetical protein QOJ67_3921 [Acidimicrobiaceae bacterium]|jgi:hypothetical protein